LRILSFFYSTWFQKLPAEAAFDIGLILYENDSLSHRGIRTKLPRAVLDLL